MMCWGGPPTRCVTPLTSPRPISGCCCTVAGAGSGESSAPTYQSGADERAGADMSRGHRTALELHRGRPVRRRSPARDDHLALCDGCATYLDQMREAIRLTGMVTEEQVPEDEKAALLTAFRYWRS